MSDGLVLAVDGGNSKTDLALVRADGEVLALVRGPQSSPHHLGARRLPGGARRRCSATRLAEAGLDLRDGAVAEVGELLLAGVDFPAEEQALVRRGEPRAAGRGGSTVRNDTFAVLRAGTERGWGVAVVCGAGINCVGVAPGRPPRALPGARRDHRRLGRRLRRRPRRGVGGGAQRGRARPADEPRAKRSRALRPRDARRARGGDPPRRDPAAARDRARAARLRRGRRTTPSRPRSSSASPRRSSRSRASR